jgi:hypothetical protein
MKFFSWLGTILVILLIIAAITAPGEQKFTNYINKDKGGDTMSCKPIIGKSTRIKLLATICTVETVSFCEEQKQTIKIGNNSYIVPKITHTETYLGLFGRFWKIK